MATTQTILNESSCIVSCFGTDLFKTLAIGILRNTLTELGAPMTPDQITAASNCYLCYGMSQSDAAMLVLLNAVSENVSGGGGGSGTIQVYEGRDPAAPDDPTKAALSYPSGGGTMTQWNTGTQTWV